MHFLSFFIIGALALSPIRIVSGHTGRETHILAARTNAERLARGLPLLPPPNMRRSRSSHKRVNASPSLNANIALPTPNLTGLRYTGQIQVRDAETKNAMGYLASTMSDQGMFPVTQDPKNAMAIAVRGTSGRVEPAYVQIMTGSGGYLAAMATTFTSEFAQGSGDVAALGSVKVAGRSAENSYFTATGKHAPTESVLFTFDAAMKTIAAAWIKEDNSTAPLDFVVSGLNQISLIPAGTTTGPLVSARKLLLNVFVAFTSSN